MLSIEDLDDLLATMLAYKGGVSDLNFTPGKPPQVEVDGKLEPVTFALKPEPLGADETEAIVQALLGDRPELIETLKKSGSVDAAHALNDGSRVRVNAFKSRGLYSLVLRALPTAAPSLAHLGLPPILEQVPKIASGLVLVTGATGSGKSTTMTALLDLINATRPVHVVTLEDPIEYVHPAKLATFNQRELGSDFLSFSEGLRAALRQAPRVIFVGEIRDRETVEVALKAAETGSLVLSTLHTIDAGHTILRILGLFDMREQAQIRVRLADVLRFAVSQRLLPKEPRGRVAAIEVMGQSLRTRELIVGGETPEKSFHQVIADSKPYGWQTFDQHIVDLYEKDLISEETARNGASDKSFVNRMVDKIRAGRGQNTSDLGDLEMAHLRRMRR